MSIRTTLGWMAQRRGNRVGPLGGSDFRWFRGIGWFLLLGSAAIFAFYAVHFDWAAHAQFRGVLRTARGTVTWVQPTGWHEPGTRTTRRDERSEISAVSYTFTDASGRTHDGVSYRSAVRLAVGSRVTVEYSADRPEVSRIRGFRTARYASMPAGLGVMAGAGALLLAVGIIGCRVYARPGRGEDD